VISAAGPLLDHGEATGTRPRLWLTLLTAAGTAVCTLVVAVTLAGTAPENQRSAIAIGLVSTVAIPIAVGLLIWSLRPQSRFGPILVAAGFGWSLATLAQSDSSFLYSVGRVSLWMVEPALLYLMLAFPSGRLLTRFDKALVAAATAIVAVLYLPTAFLVESFPGGTPLGDCDADCPANFFMLVDTTPAFVEPLRTVREVLIVLVLLLAAARLVDRIRHATHLMRRTLAPVLTAAITRLGGYAAFVPARRIAPGSPAVDVLGWVLLLTLPAIALGFLVGLVRWRLHVASAMEQLVQRVMTRPGRTSVRSAMVDALEDPSLEMAYWVPGDPGGWVGADVDGAQAARSNGGRAVTQVRDNGHPAVALVHDPALSEHPDFLRAAASIAIFATENVRLTARLRSSLDELEQSRARIVAAADLERRRIERDLHDGAQQHLVALRIKLELAEELMDTDAVHARKLLHETESEIEEALDDVRSLARGIYPSLLAEQGLKDALRAASLRVPIPTRLECDDAGRYPAAVESAVYFSCLEALQNAVKHAGATALRVSITTNGELGFEVQDDGQGFDTARAGFGQGLTNMHDRLAAVGGRLDVRSSPGHGTVVSGTVPSERRETSTHTARVGEASIPAD
jgi:signal transduction histidine kinase